MRCTPSSPLSEVRLRFRELFALNSRKSPSELRREVFLVASKNEHMGNPAQLKASVRE